MSSGAIAVILLLNGLQIGLPAPAFVEDGRTWFPARDVLTEAGIPVKHQSDRNRVIIGQENRLMVKLSDLTIKSASDPEALFPTSARNIDGRLYLPAAVLEPLGLEVAWDNTTKTLSITSTPSEPRRVSISEILDGPIQHLGSRLTTSGEYRGQWKNSLDSTEIQPLWRLQGPSEAVAYTLARDSNLQIEPLREGRRISITGRLRMSPDGLAYLAAESVSTIEGPEAVSMSLSTGRATYNRGDTVLIVARAANLLDKPIEIGNVPQLAVTNPDNKSVHTVSFDMQAPLQPGEQWREEKSWQIPDKAKEGRYCLRLEHDTVWAPRVYFEVGGEK